MQRLLFGMVALVLAALLVTAPTRAQDTKPTKPPTDKADGKKPVQDKPEKIEGKPAKEASDKPLKISKETIKARSGARVVRFKVENTGKSESAKVKVRVTVVRRGGAGFQPVNRSVAAIKSGESKPVRIQLAQALRPGDVVRIRLTDADGRVRTVTYRVPQPTGTSGGGRPGTGGARPGST
jgi:hypothetical protein